jgi:hypothetical protein
MGAGHFSVTGRFERLKEIAFEYAFLFKASMQRGGCLWRVVHLSRGQLCGRSARGRLPAAAAAVTSRVGI